MQFISSLRKPVPGVVTASVLAGVVSITHAAPSKNRLLEEVVVTAQKREESMQDVPISIQAFSGEKLDAMGIEDPKALQLVTPGLQYNIFSGYSLIYIRGVGTDAFIPSADASVATYVDNIYYPFGHSLASALGSIERVEVLKGPQGTLFGRNSTGGAINIITKGPSTDAFYASVTATLGRYDKENFKSFVNIPLHEEMAVSVSGLSYREEQYYDLHPDSPRTSLKDETSDAYAIKFAWTPGNFSAELGYSKINSAGEQTSWLPAQNVKPLGAATGVTAHDSFEFAQDAGTYYDSELNVYTGDFLYQADGFDTRLILGVQDIFSPALADYDGSQQPLVTFEGKGQFADVKTAELQLLSNEGSWGSSWLEWIAGAYYIESSAGYDPLVFSVAPNLLNYLSNPPASNPIGNLLQASVGPIFNALQNTPLAGDITGLLNNGLNLNLQGVLDTESTSLFFQSTADLNEWISLTVGGRYQEESRKLVKSTTRVMIDASDPNSLVPAFDFGQRSEDASNFSPKIALDFQVFDDDLFYASFSQGFKSGTFNIIAIYTPTQYIEPEKTTAYEVGYKGSVLDGNLRVNAAIFQNEIENLQVQTISLTSGGAVRFETAGSAKIDGAEADLTWQILPNALPGLVVTASAAYLNGRYTSYKRGSGFDERTGIFFDGSIFPSRDFTGNELVRTPQWSGNIGVNYSVDIGSGSLEMATDTYYNSGVYYSAQNTASSQESEYHITNARVSYLYYPWNTRLTLYGKNINNGEYHYAVQELDFGTAKLLAPRASYGLKINWDWEF